MMEVKKVEMSFEDFKNHLFKVYEKIRKEDEEMAEGIAIHEASGDNCYPFEHYFILTLDGWAIVPLEWKFDFVRGEYSVLKIKEIRLSSDSELAEAIASFMDEETREIKFLEERLERRKQYLETVRTLQSTL